MQAAAAWAQLQRFGRVDVLVNGAGHGPKGPVLELTDEQWISGMQAYLLNVIRATRLVTPIMVSQGGGAIINLSSAWAQEPSALFPTSAVFSSDAEQIRLTPSVACRI